MAGICKHKNGACWYACWKVGRKTVRKTTGVPLNGEPGESARKAEQRARQVAEAMERAAKGLEPLEKSLDAVRAAAASSGLGAMVPSVRAYLETVPRTASPQSERNRQRAFKLFLEFLGAEAERRLDLVQGEKCRQFVRWALGRVSRGTVENYKKNLSAAFKRAVEVDGYMGRNPFAAVNMGGEAKAVGLGEDKTKRVPFTPQEIRFMISSFPEPWRSMVAVSLYLGGIRLSDVCLLRWASVDWEEEVVRFVEKKTEHLRVQPLISELRAVLERWRVRTGGDEYVFPDMARRYHASHGSVSTEFTALLRAHGMIGAKPDKPLKGRRRAIAEKSFHSLRHSSVSVMRQDPALTADVVRDTVGHDSEEVERGYFTGSMDNRRKALEVLAAAVDGAEGKNA